MFISRPVRDVHGDCYYVATRSKASSKYIWRRIPARSGSERIIPPSAVPERIREAAYDLFERDRLRERISDDRQAEAV